MSTIISYTRTGFLFEKKVKEMQKITSLQQNMPSMNSFGKLFGYSWLNLVSRHDYCGLTEEGIDRNTWQMGSLQPLSFGRHTG